jgi:hypothetical protein
MTSETTSPPMTSESTTPPGRRTFDVRTAVESPWAVVAAVVAVAVPFVIAAVRLATQRWYPVLDLAMTEFRVRDVGTRHTPLIGLPGRIGDFPDQGSHPGPLSFYLVAVAYRVLGSAAWAMLVGALAVGLASATACILIARRLGGIWLQAAVVVLLLVVVQGYGMNLLSQPWNPYLPLLPWLAVLLAVWAVVAGDHAVLWVATAAGSLAAQTHLPYVGLAGGTVVLSMALVAWRWQRTERGTPQRSVVARHLSIGVGVGVVCWLPVVVDQLFGSRNMSMIVDYFRHPPEIAIGYRAGGRLLLRHLDVTRLIGGSVSGSGELVEASSRSAGSVVPGALVLMAWIATGVVAAVWLRHRRLVALHAVVMVCVVIGAYSMTRIFGKVWYYLTLWAWSVTALMAAATLWTLIEVVRRTVRTDRSRQVIRGAVAGALLVVGVTAWVSAVGGAIGVEVPEPRLSRSLGAVVDPTAEALRAGVGAADGTEGRYSVLWNDAFFFGSQGYGLISELERRGFDAGAPYTWRVPVTKHRVIDVAEATAVVQLVTGSFIERWRSEPAAVEVATFEPRSAAEMEEYDELRSRLVDGLRTLPVDPALLEYLLEIVDTNLFGVQLDPAVPPELQRVVNRMLELGQETAVFIVPADFYGP